MSPHEQPPAQLRARLMAEAARVSPPRPGAWTRRLAASAVTAAVWLSVALLLLGVRRDWRAVPVGALATTVLALLAVATWVSATALARGRSMVGASVATQVLTASGSLLGLLAVVVMGDADGTSAFPLAHVANEIWARAPRCVALTIGIAFPLLILGANVPRGLTLARPTLVGACVGLAAATWAHVVVRLHCSIGGAGHAVVGHLLPAIPMMVLGMWLIGKMEHAGERTADRTAGR